MEGGKQRAVLAFPRLIPIMDGRWGNRGAVLKFLYFISMMDRGRKQRGGSHDSLF
jgi:hypothetical protein